MSQNCMSKKELMDQINRASFAAYDMLLYLDTHPCDEEAMAYYQRQCCIRKEAVKEYEKEYAPLTMEFQMDECGCDTWAWMKEPWPWEMEKKGRC